MLLHRCRCVIHVLPHTMIGRPDASLKNFLAEPNQNQRRLTVTSRDKELLLFKMQQHKSIPDSMPAMDLTPSFTTPKIKNPSPTTYTGDRPAVLLLSSAKVQARASLPLVNRPDDTVRLAQSIDGRSNHGQYTKCQASGLFSPLELPGVAPSC